MRLGTYNIENLFDRPKAMNLSSWEAGQAAINDCSTLNSLIQKARYSEDDKLAIYEIMSRHPGLIQEGCSDFIRYISKSTYLLDRTKTKVEVNGRDDWIGWFELTSEPIMEVATQNTGRIIQEIAADVLCVVEVESRVALKRFNEQILRDNGLPGYRHIMVIDGNDERGIDVGIMLTEGYEIIEMKSHVDDIADGEVIFSRDCPEYLIKTPNGNLILVLVNHFKSRGGKTAESDRKRMRQATRVGHIVAERQTKYPDLYIAVVGDLNDHKDAWTLEPLLTGTLGLRDVTTLATFETGGEISATYGAKDNKRNKIDYILMNKPLYEKAHRGGICRKGIYGSLTQLPTIASEAQAASDHAALWVDLDI